MNITICGGGSLGHVLAAVLGSVSDNKISLLTGHPNLWGDNIEVIDNNGFKYATQFSNISDDPRLVIPNADCVIFCLPGYLIKKSLYEIKSYLSENTIVGSVVASTGFFYFAHEILNNSQPLFAFQRVPYIARVDEYGKSAFLLGYKSCLNICVENLSDKLKIAFIDKMSKALKTPIYLLNNYLEVSFSNSNPILHPSRLFGMWHNWHSGLYYENHTLFYKDWDDYSSEILIKCDMDFFNISHKLPIENHMPKLLDYYESNNIKSLTSKIRSIPAFQSILAPMKHDENGYFPDVENRYFKEDFEYGIYLIKDIAVQYDVDTPMIDEIISWSKQILK